MGMILGKAMDDSMKRNQEFMQETQRVMLERNIQMQNQMRERMMAQQIARTREMFTWLATFYVVAGVAMIRGYRITKNPAALAPLLPLTFIVGYQGDAAYGSKMNRIKSEAENILMFERDLIESPLGLPTISTLDVGRMQLEEQKRYHSSSVPDK